MRQIMADGSNTRPLVIVDHQGRTGLDAAAYYLGHGLQNVRCLRGGIDAWAQEVEPTMRRYRVGRSPRRESKLPRLRNFCCSACLATQSVIGEPSFGQKGTLPRTPRSKGNGSRGTRRSRHFRLLANIH